ncbi:hypothetical protein IAU60_005592 [Kwoniella sp. DSM 27419]
MPLAGPPPRYTAVVRKVYPYSLRPIVIFTGFIGAIYGIALGVACIKDLGDDGETAKMKLFDIIMAILYFVIGGIEVFAIFVAFVQKLPLARFLLYLAPAGLLINTANQVIAIAVHFSMKDDLIKQCVNDELGDMGVDRFGTVSEITQDQAQSICDNAWDRGTWSVFAWLFLSLILSLLFASICLSYYRQLLDPASVRVRNAPPPDQSFQMQPGYYPPPANGNNNQWMVPPYPGPPQQGAPPPPGGYEKSDYHPEAGWAQGEYAPPAGPPPGGFGAPVGRRDVGENREEEEAWERAQSEGVTAHLTGHAAPPRQSERETSGYVIGNNEEDEAWERARAEGVTSHLTGQHGSGSARTREGAI